MLILGIPVMDGHELTRKCVDYLGQSIAEPQGVGIMVIDNGSDEPYTAQEFSGFRNLSVLRLSVNQGYYRPIEILRSAGTPGDIVALMHNDVFVYEEGWDVRLRSAFISQPDLGMVGFFGSNEVDERGGRGGGSMCFFDGSQGQSQAAGRRITDLQPSLVLDSLFMAVRAACVPLLRVDQHIPICHFMDKVWPLRLVDAGWKVGTLGVRIDHLGGQTATGARFDEEARQWCIRERLTRVTNGEATATEPGGLMLYLEAERRFLTEMRDKRLVPSRMRGWEVVRGGQ